jgi:dihydroorotate dehydrogenase electron transfer subunit
MTVAPHWRAALLAKRAVGRFHVVTVSGPEAAGRARAGQYASVAVGGPSSSLVLRRQLWIADTSAAGRHGGSLDLVVDAAEPGGAWLVSQAESAVVDTLAPLGRPFSLPRDPAGCVLIGFGAANAALVRLGQELVARGSRVTALLPADGSAYGGLASRRIASRSSEFVAETLAGTVADAAAECDVVYSAGTAEQIRTVVGALAGHSVAHQTALHLDVVCGVGTCTACAIPVQGRDGVTRMVRACAEGAVFNAALVRWADLGTVPGDCLGAPVEAQRSS